MFKVGDGVKSLPPNRHLSPTPKAVESCELVGLKHLHTYIEYSELLLIAKFFKDPLQSIFTQENNKE